MAVNEAENEAEIHIYDEIGFFGISATRFIRDLKALGSEIETIKLYLNSPGGEVFDGNAIINALSRHKAKIHVTVDGLAASMASGIAMAGDTVAMAENAMMMIHNPWNVTAGDADEMRKNAEFLDKLKGTLITNYVKKTGLSHEEISDLMDAETWMDAEEAVELGFADEIAQGRRAAASTSFRMLDRFKNLPPQLNFNSGKVPETKNQEQANMSNVAKLLGLSEDAKQEQITAAIAKLQTDSEELAKAQDALTKVTAERDELRAAAEASSKAAAEATVQAAIDAKKIKPESKDSWVKMFLADAEATKSALDAIESPKASRGHPPLPTGKADEKKPDDTFAERLANAKSGSERIEIIREMKAAGVTI